MASPVPRVLKVLLAPFAGYLVFSVGAWKVGPLIGVQGRGLWFLRGGLLVLGAAAAVVIGWLLVQRARRVARGAAVDEINAAFKVAAQRLAAAKGVKVRSLRDLPLILIFGPEGSSKTTTMLQAGLDPDLLAGEPLQGTSIAPTKQVNLWYAHGALFAEVGGKLLANPDAWEHLATRLRPKRLGAVFAGKPQPPRAALLCFSCEDLVSEDQEKVRAAAAVLRDRLSVASRTLGIRLPVYVVFTKADRIRNFPEFVRELTSEEAQQALGSTLPLALPTDMGAYATREFDRLSAATETILSSLALQRMRLLPRLTAQDERSAAYEFPRELKKLTPRFIEFLVEVCRPRHLDVSPFVRGLYLSGVRPVVIDAPNPSVAPTRVPQWLFLSGLFHEVVRKDSVALGMMQAGHGVRQLRRLAFGSLFGVGVVTFAGTSLSFLSNGRLTKRMQGAAEAVARLDDAAPLPEALAAMDVMRKELVAVMRHRTEGRPWRQRWGLYRGADVTAEGRRIYWAQFQKRLLAPVRDSIGTELQVLTANPDGVTLDSAFNLVATYLRVTSRPDKLTPDSAARLIDRSESRLLVGADLALAQEQFRFYGGGLCAGDGLCQQELNLNLANRSCATLTSFEDTDRRYAALLERVGAGSQPVRFTSNVLRNTHEVPAAFTRAAWQEAHRAFTRGDLSGGGEDWVYQGIQCEVVAQRDVAGLTRELHRRYDDAYLENWRSFLASARIAVRGGVEGASADLKTLGEFQSPLLRMLALVSDNTSSGSDSIVLGDSTLLLDAFQPAHKVMPPTHGTQLVTDANKAYAGELDKLGNVLKSAPNDSATLAGAIIAARDAAQQLKSGFSAAGPAAQVGSTLGSLLDSPILQVEQMLRGLRGQQVGASIAQFCRSFNSVMSMFPFSPGGPAAAPKDITRIFHPTDGELAKLSESLVGVMERRGDSYERAPNTTLITNSFVSFYNRAMGVGRALFGSDGKGPRLEFTIWMPPPTGVAEIVLILDGRAMSRTQGTSGQSQIFTGVAQDVSASVASIRLIDGARRQLAVLDFPGAWGIFRLFGNARWGQESDAGVYPVTWRIPGDGRTYEVVGRINPIPRGVPVLDPAFLSSIRCPR